MALKTAERGFLKSVRRPRREGRTLAQPRAWLTPLVQEQSLAPQECAALSCRLRSPQSHIRIQVTAACPSVPTAGSQGASIVGKTFRVKRCPEYRSEQTWIPGLCVTTEGKGHEMHPQAGRLTRGSGKMVGVGCPLGQAELPSQSWACGASCCFPLSLGDPRWQGRWWAGVGASSLWQDSEHPLGSLSLVMILGIMETLQASRPHL